MPDGSAAMKNSDVRLDLHPEARSELRSAALWYDEQRPGLGDEFIADVSATRTSRRLAVLSASARCIWPKGLEFRAVVVMACDDEVIPSQQRIQTVADEADLEDVYNTERHLLDVACTRARDHVLVTSVARASEFLD
jgi:UvrD-like helicase family protein